MKKVFSMIAVAALACSVSLPAAAVSSNNMGAGKGYSMSHGSAGRGKIAIVDMRKVVQNSPEIAADKKKLQQQFTPDIKKAQANEKSVQALKDKYKKEHATMRPDQLKALEKQIIQKQTALLQSQQQLQQKIGKVKQQDFDGIIKAINSSVAQIAKRNGYAIVLPKRTAVYTDPSQVIDITSQVSAALGQGSSSSAMMSNNYSKGMNSNSSTGSQRRY
ncbi:MAG: OmpH family outer membrane protein [Gammaproteobacteria bacterium]|nr:OmpH family outer membrane protein [Gammaproteobacteria bacterium]